MLSISIDNILAQSVLLSAGFIYIKRESIKFILLNAVYNEIKWIQLWS